MINRPPTASVSKVQQVAATEAGKMQGAVQTSKTQQTDKLQLSAESQQLQELEASVGTETPIDIERVKALRAVIAKGEYKVDSARVAEKMLNFEGELFK